ncbi:hypothetical protein EBR25_04280 [bacterium]|nr:hypothetical protein [bacterium]
MSPKNTGERYLLSLLREQLFTIPPQKATARLRKVPRMVILLIMLDTQEVFLESSRIYVTFWQDGQ